MKRFLLHLIIWSASLFPAGNLAAQPKNLQQGMEHFMNGSYFKALEYFNQAIALDRSMSPEMFTEAYYYRGLTYIRLQNEAFTGEDKKEQHLYRDALLSAYNDFKSSLGYDNGQVWKQIDLEIRNLHHPLLQEGLVSLNAYNEQVYNGNADANDLVRAEKYLLAAKEIRESYLVCDLLGQVSLDKARKTEAAEYFSRSVKLYNNKLPDEPDFLMAYVFYRLAAIHKNDSIRLAMQECQMGLNFLKSEYARFTVLKNKLKPERATEMENQYHLALNDLNNLRLDLYLSNPDLYVEALHVFEEELSGSPEDPQLLLGYASLLERSDKEKAIGVYKKVLVVDPNQPMASFNLGALYYTKGKELYEKAANVNDEAQYAILTNEAEKNFIMSRSYFEQSFDIDPGSLETVQALKTLAFLLDEQADYQRYQELEKTLNH